MTSSERVRPPWWLKPMNKVFVAILRLGLPISGKESPRRYVVEGFPGADWAANVRAVFRFDPVAS